MAVSTPARRRLAALTAMSVVLGTAGALAIAAPAMAATYTVTNTSDALPGSLRDAIGLANTNPGADTINFSAAVLNSTVQIATVLTITESLTITGLGSGSLSIARTANSDIFAFQPAAAGQDFTLSGITVQGNGALSGTGVVATAAVAAPRNVTITDVSFVDLRVTGTIGGPAMIINGISGTLRIDNSGFNGNATADGSGGAVAINSPLASVTISDSQFDSNSANTSGAGGAVFIDRAADVVVSDTSFGSNSSVNAGGGLAVFDATSLVVTDSVFSSNAVTGNRGGGLVIGDIVGLATISATTFSLNTAAIAGGAIATIDNSDILIQNSTFVDNFTDGNGGAFFTDPTTGTITIERSTFDSNEAVSGGGALYLDEVNPGGSLTIDSSTFTGSQTNGYGASLLVETIEGEVTVINSTLDEQLPLPVGTTAVATAADGEFRIRYSTISGQVYFDSNEGVAEILSSVVDGLGQPAVVVAFNDPATVSYSILSSGLNGDVTDGGGNQFSVADTKLGPLQDNGGPTETRLPLAGSPAIDRGLPGGTPPTFDQRFTGFPRVIGGRVDVGSVELAQPLPATGAPFPGSLVAAGGLLLLLGVGIVVGARRRLQHP